ncbi:MAG: AAA family ATPase [Anaerolineae bacterium]|jgi:chromosome segregation protein
MRLKRLELQGYKSFANRTDFVFPTGVTAIVGPNGSGKSNIADAIRWALGEQSMRSLRGKRTVDMIFSGSRRRARAGMAEVLLTLDNRDDWLPIDFTEVTIGRRAHRSSENEYLLNDNQVRLRDINQLLAESGLSERTYAVVGQGLIDTALSLRPQERRALFEEAAGIAVYRSEREKAANRLEETDHNLERVKDILSEITPRLRRLEHQVDQLREHQRITSHLQRLQRTWYGYHWGQAQEALREAQERARLLERRLSKRRTEAEEIGEQLQALRHQQTTLRTRLRDAYRRTADLHDRADAAQREVAALTERARLLKAQREEMAEELVPLQAQRDAQQEQVEAARARLEELQSTAAQRQKRLSQLERDLDALQKQAQRESARQAETRRKIEALQQRRVKLDAAVDEARATQVRLEAEQELLARLREEGSALGQGVRTLLEAGLPGVEGLLGALIRVPQAWETAVESALGAKIQAVVVRDWQTVATARAVLGPDERAILLPLEGLDVSRSATAIPSGTQRATDVVNCPPKFRPAVTTLLRNVFLAQDLTTARAARSNLPAGGKCVTQAGEVVGADGTVAVGISTGAVLAQERTWRQLPERLETARERQAELESEAREVAEQITDLERVLAKAERGAAAATRAAAEAESGPLSEARTELALARQALETQRDRLGREVSALDQLTAQYRARKARVEELAAERTSVQQRLTDLEQTTERLERQLAQARAEIGPAEEELTEKNEAQEQTEQAERRARERLRRAEEQAGKAQLEVTRRQDRLERLQERIQEELGLVELEVADQVTAQTPLPLRPFVSPLPTVEVLPEGLKEEIQWLKSRLRQIGHVNPDAAEEYQETQERHSFLTEQVHDLEVASARLREVIADLDRMMEVAFRDTFVAVAAAFEETFARLFDGGTARLELTDPDDLMITGVDIVARPPGKRLQSLALLSGGERALSAAALIFAILRVRPTPVCVLDEVDAMLDETNVGRFREMVQELSDETQFILITHNRHTVEAAGTVYGISMGSDGVSQVVSLRMTDAAKEKAKEMVA